MDSERCQAPSPIVQMRPTVITRSRGYLKLLAV